MARYVEIESEEAGSGREARRGDTVTISYKLFLKRGELVQALSATFKIGERRVIAGLEDGVVGMRVGGQRRFRVGPHLAYGDAGVVGVIPPNAVLIFDVTLDEITGGPGNSPERQ